MNGIAVRLTAPVRKSSWGKVHRYKGTLKSSGGMLAGAILAGLLCAMPARAGIIVFGANPNYQLTNTDFSTTGSLYVGTEIGVNATSRYWGGDAVGNVYDSYNNNNLGAGNQSDSYNVLTGVHVFSGQTAYSSSIASVDESAGQLRAGSFSEATGSGQPNGLLNESGSESLAGISDKFVLSHDATVDLSGTLSGVFNADGNSETDFSLLVGFWKNVYQPYGGVAVSDQMYGFQGSGPVVYPSNSDSTQIPFDARVNLPGNSDIYFFAQLVTNSSAGSGGGAALSDFSHTMNFSLTLPAGVMATSENGLPFTGGSTNVPAPGTLGLYGTGLLGLAWVARRKLRFRAGALRGRGGAGLRSARC